MRIIFVYVGKTDEDYLKESVDKYLKRINRYVKAEELVLAIPKTVYNLPVEEIKKREGEELVKLLGKQDRAYIMLLDELGKEYNSKELASQVNKVFSQSYDKLIFVIGGAFGFSEEVYKKCVNKLALSKLTFSHQMVRLFLVEQVYRVMTILNNEKYHH